MPYRLALIQALPVIWYYLDLFASAETLEEALVLRWIVYVLILWAVIFPLWYKIGLIFLARVSRAWSRIDYVLLNVVVHVMTAFGLVVMLMVFWTPLQFFKNLQSPLPMLIWGAMCLILVLVLYGRQTQLPSVEYHGDHVADGTGAAQASDGCGDRRGGTNISEEDVISPMWQEEDVDSSESVVPKETGAQERVEVNSMEVKVANLEWR